MGKLVLVAEPRAQVVGAQNYSVQEDVESGWSGCSVKQGQGGLYCPGDRGKMVQAYPLEITHA